MEGYTARDVLIVMRMDFTEALHDIDEEIAQINETLDFSGIAEQLLHDDPALTGQSLTDFPAIRQWLETVSNRSDLEREREDLLLERDDLVRALEHLEERLTGRGSRREL